MVELYSALARRRREGTVLVADYEIVIRAFSSHSATDYDFVELTLPVIDRARELLDHHPLRANDAVQLASALIANQGLIKNELPVENPVPYG